MKGIDGNNKGIVGFWFLVFCSVEVSIGFDFLVYGLFFLM